MFEAYKEHLNLQRALGLNNVGDLNKALEQGHASEVIMISEAMQEKQIAHIADEIAERYKKGVRIVLIAGPSSSGKTTTCKRLEIQLATNLLRPVGISLDDYFVNREDTPKDESGDYDFESLYALDLPYFNSDLQRLINGEEIEMPSFDFSSGKRVYKGKKMKLYDNSVIVIEGIHGLNPELTAHLDDSLKYRIYVSALTSISLDNHNWIPTTDNRLLRRIIGIIGTGDIQQKRPSTAGQVCVGVKINGSSPIRNMRMRPSTVRCCMSWLLFGRMQNPFWQMSRKSRLPMPKPTVCCDSCGILNISHRKICPRLHC